MKLSDEVEVDGVGVVAVVADREVLAGLEQEVAAALADDDGALHARAPTRAGRRRSCAGGRAAGSRRARWSRARGCRPRGRARGRRGRRRRRAAAPRPPGRRGAGSARSPRRARSASCVEASAMPVMPAASQPWNTARFSAAAMLVGGLGERRRGRRRPRRGRRRAARCGRARTARAARRAASTRRCAASTPSAGASASAVVRPRFVAEYSQPWGPAKSTSLRAARAVGEPLARLVVDQLPRSPR